MASFVLLLCGLMMCCEVVGCVFHRLKNSTQTLRHTVTLFNPNLEHSKKLKRKISALYNDMFFRH